MRTIIILLMLQLPAYADINLDIIAKIESNGNHRAVGDSGRALGAYQLHKGVIDDWNRSQNTRFSHKIAFSRGYSRKIAHWYLNRQIPSLLSHYKIKDTTQNRLQAYNQGILSLVKKKKRARITKKYIKKYNLLLLTGNDF